MKRYPVIRPNDIVSIDVETFGLDWWKYDTPVFGVALSVRDEDYYWDLREQRGAIKWLCDNIIVPRTLVGHHVKFDAVSLLQSGVPVPLERLDCTMIRAALIDEHLLAYDLDSLGRKYLDRGKNVEIYEKLADMFGGKASRAAQMPNLSKAPSSLVAPYAKLDARLALDLWTGQEQQIKIQELERITRLERDLLPVIVKIERRGVRVDVKATEKAVIHVGTEIDALQQQLNLTAGMVINPNPSGTIHKLFQPKQGKDGIWKLIDGTTCPTTGGGKASIDADTLRRAKHPAAIMILELRQLHRMRDTFLMGHVLGHQHNGIVHCSINQTRGGGDAGNEYGTGTGRLSITDPALQQIPKRNRRVAEVVRSVFVPFEGDRWVRSDFAQFEVRFFAHYANNPVMIQAYQKNPRVDFHGLIAKMTGLPRDATGGGMGNAKQINLGLIFGMSPGRMAKEMGLPYEVDHGPNGQEWLRPGRRAQELFDRYHESVPGVKEFLEKAAAVAKHRGFVRTAHGRKLRFPNGQLTHKAGGLILQGSAADAIKVKMIEADRLESELGSKLLFSVHDELDLSVPRNNLSAMFDRLTKVLESFHSGDPIPLRVPVIVEISQGYTWWEATDN